MFTLSKNVPTWAWCSLAANGLLLLTVATLVMNDYKLSEEPQANATINYATDRIRTNRPSPL
ncbi:MAG: hypothetical protein F6K34_30005, partial [Okeania sp. SIO4D6]|nr:hypothetical protein [Okeania sp. SIO4D6]